VASRSPVNRWLESRSLVAAWMLLVTVKVVGHFVMKPTSRIR
jgi:hypothetical protein